MSNPQQRVQLEPGWKTALAGEFEQDYMPLVGNNRDGIPEEDFANIYNDRASPEYQNRVIEIKGMIHSRPLFENL